MKLEDITQGMALDGLVPGVVVLIKALTWHGNDALNLIYESPAGGLNQAVVYRVDEDRMSPAVRNRRPFDAPANEFKLAAEAQRIQRAGLYDPMLAVATSEVTPLPHQIRAVYGEMLPRRPLRFLLADDPGAGKTIMAGLLIKELLLRDDVHRCLIVAPGGLVDQWQDELDTKFGLRFEVLQTADVHAAGSRSVFDDRPFLLARMDQLARNEDLLDQLGESEWDLVVVDEAHRMSARWFGGELKSTRRYELGQLLGEVTRHLLLMTATPHNGVDEDFQTFLSLLDRDQFVGRSLPSAGRRNLDTSRYMRRMVKEDLLTFEGKPLFPERVAQSVAYELSGPEQDLYDRVTEYVRVGMGRADALNGARRRTVGFALTVLQRRLASSPAAIHESLLRRAARLESRARDLSNGVGVAPAGGPTVPNQRDWEDEYAADELEDLEEELVDAATAARTVEELRAEVAEVKDLAARAHAVRTSGQDVKWSELRSILEQRILRQGDGVRKVIVFTEHRDTLDYLVNRSTTLLGTPEAVVALHGGVNRAERKRIAEEFSKNPDCHVLVATDAAGEGLNLQAAHLMVNYDLPWNPNRLEQRFGRIHRIGQQEVCRLWNLVAVTTREGEVYKRLLDKVEEQRLAYGGKVFDVLGGVAFENESLRDLLLQAIRYGEQPEVRERMNQVIDAGVAEGLQDLMDEALSHDILSKPQLAELRRSMDEARARRLQPHYIESAFRAAFERLDGRMARRERARFQINRVPASVRGLRTPVASAYERVTFETTEVEHPAAPRADLLAPGHPLHDEVMARTVRQLGPVLELGTVLVSPTVAEPTLLVGVTEEIVDGTGEVVDRRFGYANVAPDGAVTAAGPAPYLDGVALPDGADVDEVLGADWLAGAEEHAVTWLVEHDVPDYLESVVPRRRAELEQTRAAVDERLSQEMNRLGASALEVRHHEDQGQQVRESSANLLRKAAELRDRHTVRLQQIDRQLVMQTPPPRVSAAALVIPATWVETPADDDEPDLPEGPPAHPLDTTASERRGVDAVLAAERTLGREPMEMPHNNPGFDIRSVTPDGSTIFIEVKARVAGAEDFVVTHTEVMTGKNAAANHRLALVSVHPDGPEHDRVRYVVDNFRGVDMGSLFTEKLVLNWSKTWAKGTGPC
ncbi:helicase-related protein [Citricoccus zhacaiensis]